MKLFFDTAPFIYLTENHPMFGDKIKRLIKRAIVDGDTMITSVVTLAEFGIMPTRQQKPEIIQEFEQLLSNLNMEVIGVDQRSARTAYKLRAEYRFLKGMDAFQLAIAINEQCDEFITNDKDLKRVTDISVRLLSDEE